MRYRYRPRSLRVIACLFALFWACALLLGQAPTAPTNVSVNAKPAQPTITLLNPNSGAVGASVTITGSGFGATQGSGTVTFNGTSATASAWSALSITATVPVGATTGNVVVSQNGQTSPGVAFTVSGASSFTGGYYYTTFAATENPLSEGGVWRNGGSVGLNWQNVQSGSSRAYGTGESPTNYDDPFALLTGTWSATQWAAATAYVNNQGSTVGLQEIEFRLLSTVSANVSQGYEVLFSVLPSDDYIQLVRWNGALNDFTLLATGHSGGVATGDFFAVSVENGGFRVYKNGTEIVLDCIPTATPPCVSTTFTSGNPGLGFYKINRPSTTVADAGWADFRAGDGGLVMSTSCTTSALSTAFAATGTGDTVLLPPGSCTWTSGVSWTAPANVTLMGAGTAVTGGGDVTVITDNLNRTTLGDVATLAITTNATGSFRLSGVTIQGSGVAANQTFNGAIRFGGNSKLFRMDHVHLANLHFVQSVFDGWIYGVVDHVIVEQTGVDNAFRVHHGGWNGDALGVGDQSWAAATAMGSASFLYVEDSDITQGFVNDCGTGGRFVIRYNTLRFTHVQTHSTGSGGRGRGCRAWEIYGNNYVDTAGQWLNDAVYLSSGTGVIWGNSAPSAGQDNGHKHFVVGHVDRRSNATYSQTATPNGWGYCGTSFNGTGSNWDGNTPTSTGYPCLDMLGRGGGDLLTGNFPSVVNSTTGTIAWPHQPLEPIYNWNNTWNPITFNPGLIWSQEDPVAVVNQDYYLFTASFTGAAGVGSGTRASRPGTCTTGVAWWSTDQGGNWSAAGGSNDGTLDVCTATNTWTNGVYTPYSYPHPRNTGY